MYQCQHVYAIDRKTWLLSERERHVQYKQSGRNYL